MHLQNFPTYEDDWNSWDFGGAKRKFYYIKAALAWLGNDLAMARNNGDIILVSLHDYHDNFVEPGVALFNLLMKKYDVSAVFAGHIHADCGFISDIGNSKIPFFRSGAASYQDYLVADIDTIQKQITVRKRECPYNGNYLFTDSWTYPLNDSKPVPPLPVPPITGWVTFFNEGGFVAQFQLWYTNDGTDYYYATGDMNQGANGADLGGMANRLRPAVFQSAQSVL